MICKPKAAAFVFALGSVVGCGGGGSASVSTSAPATGGSVVGSAKVSYVGKATPFLSTSTSGVTVQGLSGASISSIDLYPQPSLLNTMLLYSLGYELYTYSFLTNQSQQITHFNVQQGFGIFASECAWGPNGLVLAHSDAAGGLIQMYADGSHVTPLPTTGVVYQPQTSPDGTKIAGTDINLNFVVMNASGGSIVQLAPVSALDNNFCFSWLGNTKLVYVANGNLKTISPNGANNTLQSTGFIGLSSMSGFSDGTAAFIATTGENPDSLYAYNIITDDIGIYPLTPTGLSDRTPSIAPDNQTMAFYRTKTTGANDGYSGLWQEDIQGANARQIIADPAASDANKYTIGSVHWSPYPSYRRFVGTGGSVASASSGFLLSQVGAGISGFFNFTAKTPSTATITPATSAGYSSPLVFSVHADSITQVWWKNGYYLPSTNTTLSGQTDVVVSFNGSNGQITLVAPALATRGVAAKPAVVSSGTRTTCTGPFAAIYDGTGKNLAPGGAATLILDSKSGKLVSFH